MTLVEVATSIKYGNYKRYKKRAELQAEFTLLAVEYARKVLDLPERIFVKIRPIKGNVQGSCNKFTTIQMETRRKTMGDYLVTLMHELVHAEQFHTGKLDGNKWNGVSYRKGSTYDSYRALPWEVEAWDRQEKLARKVAKMMAKDGLDIERKFEDAYKTV